MPRITVADTDVVVFAHADEAILAALCRNGYAYRYGCRRGGCGVCKVELLEGAIAYPELVADSVLTDDERSTGTCLTCRAVAVTDVVIRLRSDDRLRCVSPLLATIAAASAARHRVTPNGS